MANASNFRNINFTALLYETLTGFLSINAAQQPTWFYKFCAACLQLFQQPFNTFVTFRNKEYLIANCKWQIGQLTNVLNYLYDPVKQRIYISQSIASSQFLMQFPYAPQQYLSDFGSAPLHFWQQLGFNTVLSTVTINVPTDPLVDVVDLTATVAQISIAGPAYTIKLF